MEDLENHLASHIFSTSMEMLVALSTSSSGKTSNSDMYDSDDETLMDGVLNIYNSIKIK